MDGTRWESISMGAPILVYPMAVDQKLNAKFVADVLGVRFRIWPSKTGESGHGSELVSCEDVRFQVNMCKCLLES
jgi:hypothetical protein